MPTLADVLPVLHLTLLSAFVGVASVSMLATLISYLRIRRPLMAWRRGPFRGFPLGPALFTIAVSTGLVYAWWTGYPVRPSLLIGYPAGGLFWCIGAFFSQSVLVTHYGVIYDINRISRSIAWGQIVDYFVVEDEGGRRYVFLYQDTETSQRGRFELRVPADQAESFHDIVEAKLDARFSHSKQRAYDTKPLEE